MKSYNSKFFRIRALSNLHVGSGETNYGIIDNLIQRDVLTGFPCINASGLKGAFKQFLDSEGVISDDLKYIFGSDTTANKVGQSNVQNQTGEYVFFNAYLLTLPLRSNKRPYFLATCPSILKHIITNARKFKDIELKDAETFIQNSNVESNKAYIFNKKYLNATIENDDLDIECKTLEESVKKLLFGEEQEELLLISDKKFSEYCSDNNLPVVSRNALDDGKSKNLWYEQILPRESRLFFSILEPTNSQTPDILQSSLKDNVIQIGGNASIGCGFCEINQIEIF